MKIFKSLLAKKQAKCPETLLASIKNQHPKDLILTDSKKVFCHQIPVRKIFSINLNPESQENHSESQMTSYSRES